VERLSHAYELFNSTYFQFYYTISELELKDINSLCCIIIVDKKKVRKYLMMRKSIRYNVLFLVGPCEVLKAKRVQLKQRKYSQQDSVFFSLLMMFRNDDHSFKIRAVGDKYNLMLFNLFHVKPNLLSFPFGGFKSVSCLSYRGVR